MITADKRWHGRAERWAAPGLLFDVTKYGVEVASERDAKALVAEHHYSGTFPAARVSIGLIEKIGPCAARRLVGVAVFSVPMNQRAITAHAGIAPQLGVELGRFVCLPDVAYNGESWFLRRAFQCLQAEKPEVQAVISYADPVERTTPEGALCKPAHAGTIYQVSNASYVGRAEPRWIWLTRDGRVVSERALTKLRAQHRGREYAERQLVAAGAPARARFEDPRAWLTRVLVAPTFRRLKHPGNLTYVFGLARDVKRAAQAKAQPYPKLERAA